MRLQTKSECSGLQDSGVPLPIAPGRYDQRIKIPLQGLIIQENREKVKPPQGDLCTLPRNPRPLLPDIYILPRAQRQS